MDLSEVFFGAEKNFFSLIVEISAFVDVLKIVQNKCCLAIFSSACLPPKVFHTSYLESINEVRGV
jgi:hypothetical protein